MSSKGIIYILGAGRSGSTILATVLNSHSKIKAVGELHHFFSYLKDGDHCSCGRSIYTCEFWAKVAESLPDSFKMNSEKYEKLSRRMEYHSSIPRHLMGLSDNDEFEEYERVQKTIINAIDDQDDSSEYILDSAKYIGRFLSLRKIYKSKVKGIFLIRDLRGVIWSFKKKVQTQNQPLRTFFYYVIINSLSQFLSFLPGYTILKVRYEDLVDKPSETLHKIGDFLELDLSGCANGIKSNKAFSIPHIIGGNRLKKDSSVTIKKDDTWVNQMSISKKLFFYCIAFPLMLLNRYKIMG